jgi:hypothetical protein
MATPDPSERKRGRLWLTIGEAAAVLAVVIAALSYWDTHRQHVEEARREAAQAKAAGAAPAFVLVAAPEAGGRRLALRAVEPRQVIQSQRYIFPSGVLDHVVDVTAAAPRIDSAWIARGLGKALDSAQAKRMGEGRLPVAVITAYLQDGDVCQDRSVYLIGYAWRGHLLGGREIDLQGLALQRRQAAGDLQAVIDRQWAARVLESHQPSGAGPT